MRGEGPGSELSGYAQDSSSEAAEPQHATAPDTYEDALREMGESDKVIVEPSLDERQAASVQDAESTIATTPHTADATDRTPAKPGEEARGSGETARVERQDAAVPAAESANATGASDTVGSPELATDRTPAKSGEEARGSGETMRDNKKAPDPEEILKSLVKDVNNPKIATLVEALKKDGNEAIAQEVVGKLETLRDLKDIHEQVLRDGFKVDKPNMADLVNQLRDNYKEALDPDGKGEKSNPEKHRLLKAIWEGLSEIVVELAKEALAAALEGALSSVDNK